MKIKEEWNIYPPFLKWFSKGEVYILSDPHFADPDRLSMEPAWISPEEQLRILNETMGESQTVKTLIHEIAHALVHDNEEETEEKDPAVREIEAESIAYSVCRYYGLDTSEFSFPYLAVFSRTKLNLQKDSMSLIQKTASQLITRINALEGIGPAEFGEGISAEEEAGQILEWN